MRYLIILPAFLLVQATFAQDANELARKVKAKLATVNDYQAKGVMKTDVSFMKVPPSDVTVYYKKPNKFRIKKQDGIAVTPKGGVSINLNSLVASDNYTAVNAGTGTVNGVPVTIIKLLPLDESSEVVVSTLYINEKELLIYKATTTTKENGTYEMELSFGKFAGWGLPDKVVFVFNTKDYKLPKGLAFDYDTGTKPADTKAVAKNTKGRVEISYTSYIINKGIDDALFR
jgi:outer membrane lipoprotein-sorting protein